MNNSQLKQFLPVAFATLVEAVEDNLGFLEVMGSLGSGAQKSVYKVKNEDGVEMALKHGEVGSLRSLERIRREVQFLEGVSHSGFPVQYFSIFDEGYRFVIVEACIDGETLTNRSMFYVTEESVIGLLTQAVDTMSLVWKGGHAHRDLKPDNLMVSDDGRLSVIDFGIAKFSDQNSLTNPNALSAPCTPYYASPEQLSNRRVDLDWRTDLFSLGVIIHELAYKQHPCAPGLAGGVDLQMNIETGTVSPLNGQLGFSKEFDALLAKLLGSEPYLRYRSLDDLQKDLTQLNKN